MAVNNKAIYVSFSNKDISIVQPILNELNALNLNFWIDDEHIEAGESWVDTIEDALNEASVYVLLMSPDFVASEWSMYELGHAITAFKRTGATLVPVIIREVAMPIAVSNIQYLDAISMSPEEIAKKIKEIVEREGSSA
jgi:hypothetical protein